tara:strand:- start:405 stop:572 length:168 start_codon:yes stop_codon:yes gene_type:complete
MVRVGDHLNHLVDSFLPVLLSIAKVVSNDSLSKVSLSLAAGSTSLSDCCIAFRLG